MTENPYIAVLVDSVGSYQEELVAGIEAIFKPLGICTVVILGRELNPESEHYKGANQMFNFAQEAHFAGVIVASASMSHNTDLNTVTEFVKSFDSKPLVSMGLELPNVSSVVVDNKVGVETLVRHLVEVQGHERFVFMRGFYNNTDSMLRERAVVSTLADYDLTIEPDLFLTGNFISSDAYTQMNLLLAKRSDFDVVVTANDLMALGVIKSLDKHGFRVPHDIAVTGFDDHQDSYSSVPSLTTIRQPTFEVGQKAARLMLQKLEAQTVDDLYEVPTQLIIRKSCGGKVLVPQVGTEELSSSQSDEQYYIDEYKKSKAYESKLLPLIVAFSKYRQSDSELVQLFRVLLDEHSVSNDNNHVFFEFLDFIRTVVLETISDQSALKRASHNYIQLYQILTAANQKVLVQKAFERSNAMEDSRSHSLKLSLSTSYEEWYQVVVPILEESCKNAFVFLYDTVKDTNTSTLNLVASVGSKIDFSELPIAIDANQLWLPELLGQPAGKYYCMPLFVGRDVYGFILVDTDDQQILEYEGFAHGLSIAIRNSKQILRLKQHTKELEQANNNLATLAQYDSLTGLPNRSLLAQRLDDACLSAQDNGSQVALFFLDLDGFKYINDSLGHDSGDILLQKTAERLSNIVNSEDTVARLGGDEFTIVMVDVQQRHEVVQMAEKIIAVLNEAFCIKESTFRISASIGIAMFPEDNKDTSTLMKYADVAMYKAKNEGKNCYSFYNSSLSEEAFAELQLSQQLRNAIDNQEIWLAYQPRFDIEGKSVLALESLARWNRADGSSVSPGEFIPVAEKYGLINEIGMYILKQACLQAKVWCDNEDLISPSISVNLSAIQLHEDKIVEQVAVVLTDVGLEPSLLELEITESAAMIDVEQNIEKLHRFRDLGVKIAIDDFGTAYSSLNYLKRLPVTSLKIDQSFVKDIDDLYDVSSNTAVIRAVIALGKSMDFNLVAEGVETAEQMAFLKHYECNELQGFYLARPMPADKAELLLRKSEQGVVAIPPDEKESNHKFFR